MKLLFAVLMVVLGTSTAAADEWYTPSMGACEKAELSPKQLMDLITKVGGDYEVTDSGGKKPSMVLIKSATLKEAGAALDAVIFFRTKQACDTAAKVAKDYDKQMTDKFD